jgi:hypothetical protein
MGFDTRRGLIYWLRRHGTSATGHGMELSMIKDPLMRDGAVRDRG